MARGADGQRMVSVNILKMLKTELVCAFMCLPGLCDRPQGGDTHNGLILRRGHLEMAFCHACLLKRMQGLYLDIRYHHQQRPSLGLQYIDTFYLGVNTLHSGCNPRQCRNSEADLAAPHPALHRRG